MHSDEETPALKRDCQHNEFHLVINARFDEKGDPVENSVLPDQVMGWMQDNTKHAVWQLELGAGGYIHYQATISTVTKKRKSELCFEMNKDGRTGIMWACEVSYLSRAGRKAAWNYAQKTQTRIAGPWEWPEVVEPKDIKGIILRPFQNTIVAHCEAGCSKAEARKVNVLLAPLGNIGGTLLGKYLQYNKKAWVIPPYEKAEQIMHDVCTSREQNWTPQAYYIDIPRSDCRETKLSPFQADKKKALWSAVELIKDGRANDWRYDGKRVLFSPPVVWVKTNKLPDLDVLSPDRWVIWIVNPVNMTLVRYTPERLAWTVQKYQAMLDEVEKAEAALQYDPIDDMMKDGPEMEGKEEKHE